MKKLKIAFEKNDPFEIVLVDMQMPEMSGETLGKKIKQDPDLEKTILIMLTSAGMRGDVKRLKKIGFTAYLNKPVKQSSLYECLAAVHQVAQEPLKKKPLNMVTRHSIAENRNSGVRILLAEDNRVNQKVTLGALGRLGFMADAVMNGKQAVQALQKTKYDLILMDCQMPEMDGYQATAQIRDPAFGVLDPEVPVIAMTASAMAEDRERCLKAGMNDYLAKPVKFEDLGKMLEKWLNFKGIKT